MSIPPPDQSPWPPGGQQWHPAGPGNASAQGSEYAGVGPQATWGQPQAPYGAYPMAAPGPMGTPPGGSRGSGSKLPLILVAVGVALCAAFAIAMAVFALTRKGEYRAQPATPQTVRPLPQPPARTLDPLSPAPSATITTPDEPSPVAASKVVNTTYLDFRVPGDYAVESVKVTGATQAKLFSGGTDLEGLYIRGKRLSKGSMGLADRRLFARFAGNYLQKASYSDRADLVSTRNQACSGAVTWREKPHVVMVRGMPATRASFVCNSSTGGTNRGTVVQFADPRGWNNIFIIHASALDYVREKTSVDAILASPQTHP